LIKVSELLQFSYITFSYDAWYFCQYNGTATHPRLSVFCSDRQLYAMLVDDKNRSCLFYGSTLQKSIRQDPSCTTLVSSISTPFLTNKHCMRQGMHLLPFIFGNITKYIIGLSTVTFHLSHILLYLFFDFF